MVVVWSESLVPERNHVGCDVREIGRCARGKVKSTQSGMEWKKLSGLGLWVMCVIEGMSLKSC